MLRNEKFSFSLSSLIAYSKIEDHSLSVFANFLAVFLFYGTFTAGENLSI